MENTWEVQDSNGVIHSGTEEEMTRAFDDMSGNEVFSEFTNIDWTGDLKLVEIHKRYK